MYDELVKRLRMRARLFKQINQMENCIMDEAADAIEKLQEKEKFHTFLWNVINPNEMEQYIEMYNSKGIPVCGFPEPPKEGT